MDNQSYNTRSSSSFKSVFWPSKLEVSLYLIISVLVLVILNVGAIWNYFNSSVGVSAETSNAIVNDQVTRFSDFTNGLFQGRLAPMLFWACIGMITYMIVWVLQNAATNLGNDLEAEKFNHPIDYDRKRYWHSVNSRKIFLVFSCLIGFAFLYVALSNLLPLAAKVFYDAIYDFSLISSTLKLALDISATALLIYLLVMLFRLTRNSWRTITSNL